MTRKSILIAFVVFASAQHVIAQKDTAPKDSLSKFDSFNKKAQHFFKVFPVPIVSYSQEAGSIFGLAKFNAFHPSKKDTISKPSKISEVATFSTKGRVNVSVANDLILKENKYMILSYFNYRKSPEYMLGIGNDVSRENVESVSSDRIKFFSVGMIRVKTNLYMGMSIELANYFTIEADSNSFLITDNVTGVKGGTNIGIGIAGAWDSRDNRYNTSSGSLVLVNLSGYPEFLGSAYQFSKLTVDARKFYKPFKKRKDVLGIGALGTFNRGTVPFYDLALLGGEAMMRGYYQGALRDKALVAGQVEYRKHVWKIFGVVGFVSTGRVAQDLKGLNFQGNGYWLSYGGGLRIQVDADNDINMRIDAGFGPDGISGVYLNFAEAF